MHAPCLLLASFHRALSFFPLFDTQRDTLSNVYNEFATFSFQANTSIPARAKIQGFQYSKEMPNQRHLEWSPWLGAGSRNLSRVGGAVDKMLKSIHVGRENVLKAMSFLPSTKHDIVGAAEKFCIDSWPVTHENRTTLFLSIHGQFIEGLSHFLLEGLKFDSGLEQNRLAEFVRLIVRSFWFLRRKGQGASEYLETIAYHLCSKPSIRAKANGWDVEVLSDQLVIRGYSSHAAWAPGPLLVQAAPSSSQSSSLPPSIQRELEAIVRSLWYRDIHRLLRPNNELF
jgi:nuclear RNA export factor